MPAIKRETGEFAFLNYFEREELKPKFIFYNDPSMYDSKVNSRLRESRMFQANQKISVNLRSSGNLCPSCKKFTLSFPYEGCWD
jgi:hypothetical protein